MKKTLTRFAVGFLLITTLFSCNKLIEAFFPGFDTDINAAEITIPAVPVVTSETPVGSVTFRFNLDSIIRVYTANAFSINTIASVRVKQIKFDFKNPDAQNNAANFESMRISFASNANTEPVTIGSVNVPDTYGESISIPIVEGIELKDYMKGEQISYTPHVKPRRGTTQQLTTTIVVSISVK